MWYLYILECNDGSYYTGITNDIARRVERHNTGKGSKYTRVHRPVTLVYYEEYEDQSHARKRENELKGWRHDKKQSLVHRFSSRRLADVPRASIL